MNTKKIVLSLAISSFLSCGSVIANDYSGTGLINEPIAVQGTATIYEFNPVNQFVVNTRLGYVTDIELRPGEEVQKIAAGNTLQWSVEKDTVADVTHVYIKPLSDSATNVIINTSQRSYRLIVTSLNGWMNYIIKWNYPKEEEAERRAAILKRTKEFQERMDLSVKAAEKAKALNKQYKVKKNKNVVSKYIPLAVFDDGRKTYIEIAPGNTQNMPVVFYFDEFDKSKLQMVNYRLKGNFMEIDRVMDHIKLVFSQKSYMIFERTNEDNKIPSIKEIPLNKTSVQELATQSVNAGAKQKKDVDLHEQAPISLKEKMKAIMEKKQLELLKASNSPNEDPLNRIADILESDSDAETTPGGDTK